MEKKKFGEKGKEFLKKKQNYVDNSKTHNHVYKT